MVKTSRIRVVGVKVPDLALAVLKTAASKKAIEGNYDKIMRGMAKRIQQRAALHYRHAVDEISQHIWSEDWLPSNIQTGGRQTIRFTRVGGKQGSVRTKVWPALNEEYAARTPESTQFWRKFSDRPGSLGFAMATQVTSTQAKVKVEILKEIRSHHKDRRNMEVGIIYQELPSPLDTMLSQPFATGEVYSKHWIDVAKKEQRVGLQRLFAEMPENRPFIGLMAVSLGKDLRKSLRNL